MPQLRLRPYASGDLGLLQALNTPGMTRYLGGPESPGKLEERLASYLRATTSTTRMYVITEDAKTVGNVGYWEREWQGATVYETGWGVLPHFQGRGIASHATGLFIGAAAAEHTHRFLHASRP